MSSTPAGVAKSSPMLHLLDAALYQSHDVKAEVAACAMTLANDLAKARMTDGAATQPGGPALQDGYSVAQRVQGCADVLQQVTDNLARGVAKVKAVEQALKRSRAALAETEAALAVARNAERKATQLAMHDQKTGLPNRTLFDDRMAQAIAGAARHDRVLAVMFLDLDRFKDVNDTNGHAAGDAVLRCVAERLLRHAREEDTVCRNGGDEFLYLLINPSGRESIARIAALVRETIASPIHVGPQQFVITPSIGIALYPEHGTSAETLIDHADAAMYRAKRARSPCEFFEPATDSVSS